MAEVIKVRLWGGMIVAPRFSESKVASAARACCVGSSPARGWLLRRLVFGTCASLGLTIGLAHPKTSCTVYASFPLTIVSFNIDPES